MSQQQQQVAAAERQRFLHPCNSARAADLLKHWVHCLLLQENLFKRKLVALRGHERLEARPAQAHEQ
jgi:hypothetical protein